jgi:threonine synthase
MAQLNQNGSYTVPAEVKAQIDEVFSGYFADEEQTASAISKVWEQNGYLSDTHTAVALSCAEQYRQETGDITPMVVASTASPYKFAKDVYFAVSKSQPTDDLSALDELSALTRTDIPYPLAGLAERKIRFTDVIGAADMTAAVYATLGL